MQSKDNIFFTICRLPFIRAGSWAGWSDPMDSWREPASQSDGELKSQLYGLARQATNPCITTFSCREKFSAAPFWWIVIGMFVLPSGTPSRHHASRYCLPARIRKRTLYSRIGCVFVFTSDMAAAFRLRIQWYRGDLLARLSDIEFVRWPNAEKWHSSTYPRVAWFWDRPACRLLKNYSRTASSSY